MKINCLGLNCDLCCRRYWISFLPEEAEAISSALGMKLREFCEEKCTILLKLYARDSKGSSLVLSSNEFSLKIKKFIKNSLGNAPSFFLALPQLALKRSKGGQCILLGDGKCLVHKAAPVQCKLFPFIALSKRPLQKIYPFCAWLQKQGPLFGSVDLAQKERVNNYFEDVKSKEFSHVWRHLPADAILQLEGGEELELSLKEFRELA